MKSRSKKQGISNDYVYGTHPLEECLAAKKRQVLAIQTSQKNWDQTTWGKQAQKQRISVQVVDRSRLDQAFPGGVHQGVVAQVQPYSYSNFHKLVESSSSSKIILALDSITDPQNVGTIIRTAVAFGVTDILIPKDRSVLVTPAVTKASAGATEHVQIYTLTNLARSLQDLKDVGYWIYGASLEDRSIPLSQVDPSQKSVIVLGSEGKGLRPLVAKTCDQLMTIPMKGGFESLNVAQAATILVYEFSKKVAVTS